MSAAVVASEASMGAEWYCSLIVHEALDNSAWGGLATVTGFAPPWIDVGVKFGSNGRCPFIFGGCDAVPVGDGHRKLRFSAWNHFLQAVRRRGSVSRARERPRMAKAGRPPGWNLFIGAGLAVARRSPLSCWQHRKLPTVGTMSRGSRLPMASAAAPGSCSAGRRKSWPGHPNGGKKVRGEPFGCSESEHRR